MLKTIKNVKISAVATCVPKLQVDVHDNKLVYGGNVKKLNKVVKSTGFHKRHILEENSPVTAGDLCKRAVERLFESGIEKEDIKAVIVVTQFPDYFGPATACVVHGHLGLSEDCLTFDINQGCTGYIYGLLIASSLINIDCKKVLLLVGDTPTKSNGTGLDMTDDIPIFGDGGSATILEYDENANDIVFEIGSKGLDYDVIIGKNGAYRNPPRPDMFDKNGKFDYGQKMDGLKVFDFTMNIVPPSINKVMEAIKIKEEDVDYYVFHQANRMILENIATSASIDVNKVLRETLSKLGNLSCASIPSVICDEYEKFNQKEVNIVLSGFGIGLSWGSVALTLNKPKVLPIIYYNGEENEK